MLRELEQLPAWRQPHLRPCSCRAHARKMPSVPPHITTSYLAVPGRGVDTSCTNWGAAPVICTSTGTYRQGCLRSQGMFLLRGQLHIRKPTEVGKAVRHLQSAPVPTQEY